MLTINVNNDYDMSLNFFKKQLILLHHLHFHQDHRKKDRKGRPTHPFEEYFILSRGKGNGEGLGVWEYVIIL